MATTSTTFEMKSNDNNKSSIFRDPNADKKSNGHQTLQWERYDPKYKKYLLIGEYNLTVANLIKPLQS